MAKSDNVDMEVVSLESMKKRMDDQDAKIVEQKRIIFDQKNKLEVINEDQGKVQAGQMLAREQLRKNQKEIELKKHKSPAVRKALWPRWKENLRCSQEKL